MQVGSWLSNAKGIEYLCIHLEPGVDLLYVRLPEPGNFEGHPQQLIRRRLQVLAEFGKFFGQAIFLKLLIGLRVPPGNLLVKTFEEGQSHSV